MAKITITWTASQELQKTELVQTGEDAGYSRTFTLDLTTLTPAQRQPIVDYIGLNCSGISVSRHKTLRPDGRVDDTTYEYGCQPAIEDIVRHCVAARREKRKIEAAKERVDAAARTRKQELDAIHDLLEPQIDALIAAGDIAGLAGFRFPEGYPACHPDTYSGLWDKIEEARKELTLQARAAEKSAWITARGSERLRRAHAAGYNCQRRYVTERAKIEYPEFEVDFDDTAHWNPICCPSVAGLALAERVDGEVVRLTYPPRNTTNDERAECDSEEFEPGEAVVISGFLGKYDLVCQV